MSEARFETVLSELRIAAPHAPQSLRERVTALRAKQQRQAPRLRAGLSAAVAIAVAVAVGAAVIAGLDSTPGKRNASFAPRPERTAPERKAPGIEVAPGAIGVPSLTAKSRLQRQDVAMRLRVDDLSAATQSAVRTTRRLGGFVAGADYATRSQDGNSRLALRVPVANLQNAIASFTQLGTILAQHISVTDLQSGVDRLDKRIAAARRAGDDRKATQLLRRRAALVREGTYAKVSLQLTTTKPAAKHVVPSRLDRFRDNAGDILGKEAIAVLYALVVAGPFLLIAALVFLAERTRRRRADNRLLQETG